jgi:3-deoxy-manno-octulosonate cytidylyltransferase (CMP-KDO synthetase)
MISGMSLIQRVYERAARSQRADAAWVATDDERIAAHVRDFGGLVATPAGDFSTGTDRIAAALPIIEESAGVSFDAVVNVQGDEPLIDIAEVDALLDLLAADERAAIGTLATPFETDDQWRAPDVVKVVMDSTGLALFFSRAPLASPQTALRHVGVYAYRRQALEAFVRLPPSPLERAESLEQLRALQHGFRIAVSQTSKPHLGVDRPEDVARVERELEKLHA